MSRKVNVAFLLDYHSFPKCVLISLLQIKSDQFDSMFYTLFVSCYMLRDCEWIRLYLHQEQIALSFCAMLLL